MNVQEIEERRATVKNKFHTLIETRTETLALYNQLIAQRPFDVDDTLLEMLQEFCESLVDYSASAHFQLYTFIESGKERRGNVKSIAEQVYPEIAQSTKVILEFNEKYDVANGNSDLKDLDRDLSRVGEHLADRIQDEDKIISAMSR